MSQLSRLLREGDAPSPLAREGLPRGLAGVRELVSQRYGEPLTLADLAAAAPTGEIGVIRLRHLLQHQRQGHRRHQEGAVRRAVGFLVRPRGGWT